MRDYCTYCRVGWVVAGWVTRGHRHCRKQDRLTLRMASLIMSRQAESVLTGDQDYGCAIRRDRHHMVKLTFV